MATEGMLQSLYSKGDGYEDRRQRMFADNTPAPGDSDGKQ